MDAGDQPHLKRTFERMRKFQILFDEAEASAISGPVLEPYGNFGFPAAQGNRGRPWTYANFVQSMDGIASFKGKHASGGDIGQSLEDKWLMNLLRAHADAILLGMNTLVEETRNLPNINDGRGPVYQTEGEELRDYRKQIGKGREKVIFATNSAIIDPAAYKIFDGGQVDAFVLTTAAGAKKLSDKAVQTLVTGPGDTVDLPAAMEMLREKLGIQLLLCEGGPTLYGNMSRAGLIDEKFVTISPIEIGLLAPPEQELSEGEKLVPRPVRPTSFMASGFTKENVPWWRWISSRRVGSHEFNRYRRERKPEQT
jgi:riboflavin biosynthesis pyrimidine reductase